MWRLMAICLFTCHGAFADEHVKPVEICAQQTDPEQRLLCYDKVYKRIDSVKKNSNMQQSGSDGATTDSTEESDSKNPWRYTNETRWINALKEEVDASREDNRFLILPYRTNYILPVTYDNRPRSQAYGLDPVTENGDSVEFDNFESKIQISLKSQLAKGPLGDNSSVWVAYTQLSLWQVYNDKLSSPFREINYEPEMYIQFIDPFEYFGLRNTVSTLGINHQSNGRTEPTSRSWNRIMGSLYWGDENYVVGIQLWWRIPEKGKDDDNPDIHRYMGYGKLFSSRRYGRNTWSLTLTNNLRREDNLGSVQFDWSFPLGFTPRLKGYIQYFNGYGETLIDYNHSVNRISLGVLLTDWL